MLRLSPFQTSVLEVPRACNIALLGARGGGKTMAAIALILREIEDYQDDCSVLVVRRTLRALSDFEDELLTAVGATYPHSYNRSEKILRVGGAKVTLAAIERPGDYDKLQGKNFHMIVIEEVTQYTSERVLRLLRSNLRAPEGVTTRVVYLGNPGGPLHGRIYERHVRDRRSHVPYEVDGEQWVTIPSGPADNPFIDIEAYVKRLREACHGNETLLNQWLFGRWEQGSGLMWPMWDAETHVISVQQQQLNLSPFVVRVGIDWGLSAPSVAHIGLRTKRDMQINGIQMPRDSVIVLDEVTDLIGTPGIDEDLNTSREWVPDRLGERVAMVCADWGIRKPTAVVDNARGLQGEDVKNMIQETGHFWHVGLPKKGRRAERWVLISSMLQAAVEQNPIRPHLYVSDRCGFLMHALASATRDERSPDDVADIPSCPDHPLDSCSYMIAEQRVVRGSSGRTIGAY